MSESLLSLNLYQEPKFVGMNKLLKSTKNVFYILTPIRQMG